MTGGAVDYITSHRTPVIGNEGGWYDSPMFFPQMATAEAMALSTMGSIARQVIPHGHKKLATAMCAEVQGCANYDRIFAEHARAMGFDHVYRGRPSLVQPDYTAECLSARNAGADVMVMLLDTNSLSRMSGSCVRQGYRPVVATNATLVADHLKDDDNLAGLVTGSMVFSWFQSGSPAVDEYRQALRDHGSGMVSGVGSAMGWTVGKLLEKAAADLSEPPTSQAILDGLWSIKNDTLGGLTAPLTFTKDKPGAAPACSFDLVIQKGAWVTPDRFELHCL